MAMPLAFHNGIMVKQILENSFNIALKLNQTTITSEHVLYSILANAWISKHLESKGIDTLKLSKELLIYIESLTPFLSNKIPSNDPEIMTGQLTSAIHNMVETVVTKSKASNIPVSFFDFLQYIISDKNSYASYFLRKYGVTTDMLTEIEDSARAEKIEEPNALSEHCINLNEKVKEQTDTIIGRTKEMFSIAHSLSKKKKCNVILIGDPGVGKTMIAEGLAQKINSGDVPDNLKDKIVYSLDIGSVLAGCRYRGDFEEKIREILNELVQNKNAILYIDEADKMDAGEGKSQSGLGFSSMLKPELSRGRIKVIASTTWEGFRRTFEKDTALMRRFRTIVVEEPSISESIEILKGNKESMEEFHSVKIDLSALQSAVELTVKYQPSQRLPDKAIDVIDSACARNKISLTPDKVITRSNIIQEVSEITGRQIKSEESTLESSKEILNIEDQLNKKIFKQEKALSKVSESILISQSGLKEPNEPIGSFLFVGPSGVGKTLTARTLADLLDMKLIKYDMSEFQEKHSLSRLIGAPPGYVGFEDGGTGEGQLVNDIIKNPNSVILFDEIEKSHPDISSVLLQLFEEGKVTSTTGKIGDARNCIIILSSNLGTGSKKALGFIEDNSGKSASNKAVEGFFLTEVRGRMTAIIEFDQLDDLSYRKIVINRISDLSKLISNRNIKFIATERLIDHLLSLNNAKEYGARKIAGIVKSVIKAPLSKELLNGTIINNSVVNLDWIDNKISIIPNINKIHIPIKKLLPNE